MALGIRDSLATAGEFVGNSNHQLRKICQCIFPKLCNTLYSKNPKYTIYVISDVSLFMRSCKEMIKKR